MYLYFFIIILMIAYVIYHQYSNLYKEDKILFKGELIDVNTFFFSDSYLKQSKNRKYGYMFLLKKIRENGLILDQEHLLI